MFYFVNFVLIVKNYLGWVDFSELENNLQYCKLFSSYKAQYAEGKIGKIEHYVPDLSIFKQVRVATFQGKINRH